jgi:hypothetical protein
MKEDTTVSSGKRGSFVKGSTHSSQAESHDKWNHSGFDEIIREQQEKSSDHSVQKSIQDYASAGFKDDKSNYQGSNYYHHNENGSYKNYHQQNGGNTYGGKYNKYNTKPTYQYRDEQ